MKTTQVFRIDTVHYTPYGVNQSFPGGGRTERINDVPIPVVETRKVPVPGSDAQVPAISAASFRGRLRRRIGERVIQAIFPQQAPGRYQFLALLLSGGASLRGLRPTDEHIDLLLSWPFVYLLGGQWWTAQIPGALRAFDSVMVTALTPPAAFMLDAAQAKIEEIAREDNALGKAAERALRDVPTDYRGHKFTSVLSMVHKISPELSDAELAALPKQVRDALATTTGGRRNKDANKTANSADDVRESLAIGVERAPLQSWWAGGCEMTAHLREDGTLEERDEVALAALLWAYQTEFGGETFLGGKQAIGLGVAQGYVLPVASDGAPWPQPQRFLGWLEENRERLLRDIEALKDTAGYAKTGSAREEND